MAYDSLLKENADIRHMYHERLGALKEEVRRLRRLRSVGGWLGFQVRRLRPSRVAARPAPAPGLPGGLTPWPCPPSM